MSTISPSSRRPSSIRADEIFQWYARIHGTGTDTIRGLDLASSTYVRVDNSSFWLTPGNSRRTSRVTFSETAPLMRRDSTQSQGQPTAPTSEADSVELTYWQQVRFAIARWLCCLPR